MTPQEIEIELKHVASKDELHREITIQTRWVIGAMIALQVPTWIALMQLWSALTTIASHLASK